MGAAGSLPACNDPNVGGVLDVLVARFDSPNLSNTDFLVVVALVVVTFSVVV